MAVSIHAAGMCHFCHAHLYVGASFRACTDVSLRVRCMRIINKCTLCLSVHTCVTSLAFFIWGGGILWPRGCTRDLFRSLRSRLHSDRQAFAHARVTRMACVPNPAGRQAQADAFNVSHLLSVWGGGQWRALRTGSANVFTRDSSNSHGYQYRKVPSCYTTSLHHPSTASACVPFIAVIVAC